ncbi:C-X-C motif chemokine 16 isoform X2 [Eublepharis macularius]|uniref:C-X-C motif chemokine 16 n=1 Tax=Eublepharis macularius TaxID=481883 RepID=A0AA97LBQ6_EUBMA|nr:C-X-C motif chemokine 16 isoform X2 [Eublepharis macularius]
MAPVGWVPAPLLLLLLALLPAGPARGNEGGAAGSCRCEGHRSPPQLLTRFASKLQACDTCGDLARFSFPSKAVCGLKEAQWVIEFRNAHCPEGGREGRAAGADASRGFRLPAPTSQMAIAAQTFPSSAPTIPEKSTEMPQTAHPPTDVAWAPEMARSTSHPSAGAVAREASQSPVEMEKAAPSPDARVPIVSLLAIALVSVGVTVFVLCRRRRRQRSKAQGPWDPPIPLGEQEEGPLCLPGEKT